MNCLWFSLGQWLRILREYVVSRLGSNNQVMNIQELGQERTVKLALYPPFQPRSSPIPFPVFGVPEPRTLRSSVGLFVFYGHPPPQGGTLICSSLHSMSPVPFFHLFSSQNELKSLYRWYLLSILFHHADYTLPYLYYQE